MSNHGINSKTIADAICLYDAIQWHVDSEERPPSIRELMVMTDVPGSATIQRYLGILREWGWITFEQHAIRTIRLLRPTETIVIRAKPAKKAKRHVA
jgi:SOS-response transcriptional repressor LexA